MVTLFNQEKVMEIHDYHVTEATRRDGILKGRAEGRAEGILKALQNLMDSIGIGIDQAMNVLKIPENEQQKYTEILKQ